MSAFEIETSGSAIDDLYEALKPLAYADPQNDYSLHKLVTSIAGQLQEIEDIARDQGDVPGWAGISHIPTTPEKFLPWLGQFIGVRPPIKQPGETDAVVEARHREKILAQVGFKRGTPAAMKASAQAFLTGTKTVYLTERDTSAYHLFVQTYESETPPGDLPTTNLIINGGFESNTTGWSAWGAGAVTLVRSNENAKYGSYSGKLATATGATDGAHFLLQPITVGDVLTWSIWVCPIVQVSMALQMHQYNGGIGVATASGPTVVCPANVWTRLTQTITVVPTATFVYCIVALAGVATATTIYLDGAQAEKHAVATPYVETNGATASRPVGQGLVGQALLTQKPAGIVMVYNVTSGQTYLQLKTTTPSYSLVKSTYPTYNAVRNATP